MNLGGAMFWAMDLDDFSGAKCGEGKFPLINTAKDIVNGKQPSTRSTTTRNTPTTTRNIPTTTTRNTPTTTTKPTDQSNTAVVYCLDCKYRNIIIYIRSIFFVFLAKEKQSYANVSTNCRSYYECLTAPNGKQMTVSRTCPTPLIYDEDKKKCVKEKELSNVQIKCSTKCQNT
jgi:hypothetical protein